MTCLTQGIVVDAGEALVHEMDNFHLNYFQLNWSGDIFICGERTITMA